jgi:predicted naringenin-chalcone synthase
MLKGEREENDVLLELVKLLLVQLSVKCLTETLAARDDIVCLVFVFFLGFQFRGYRGRRF